MQELYAWFGAARRDLPWRRTRDPYAIWVSEIMLQQTRVDTVAPYYERWLARFPTVQALAAAPLDDVLKSWEGLGYYSRARNLHQAARVLGDRPVPQDLADLLAMRGVGRYTAGAIGSIAYGRRYAAVDGNVRRVLSRIFAESSDARLWHHAQSLVEASPDAGLHTQALMELGAVVCSPSAPNCAGCPLSLNCAAFRENRIAEFPPRAAKKTIPHHDVAVGIIHDKAGRMLIALRPPHGLLGGLWELPGDRCQPGETVEAAFLRTARDVLGIEVRLGAIAATVKHAFTHFKITVHAFRCDHSTGIPRRGAWQDVRWIAPRDISQYAFASATHRVFEQSSLALPGFASESRASCASS